MHRGTEFLRRRFLRCRRILKAWWIAFGRRQTSALAVGFSIAPTPPGSGGPVMLTNPQYAIHRCVWRTVQGKTGTRRCAGFTQRRTALDAPGQWGRARSQGPLPWPERSDHLRTAWQIVPLVHCLHGDSVLMACVDAPDATIAKGNGNHAVARMAKLAHQPPRNRPGAGAATPSEQGQRWRKAV